MFYCTKSCELTYPGSPEVIHRSTSGSPLQQHCEKHQAQTGRPPAEGVAAGHTQQRNICVMLLWLPVITSQNFGSFESTQSSRCYSTETTLPCSGQLQNHTTNFILKNNASLFHQTEQMDSSPCSQRRRWTPQWSSEPPAFCGAHHTTWWRGCT